MKILHTSDWHLGHTLYSYDSNPLIFAGTNGTGNRQVVFGFDLHNSDFALTTDFVILMRNLLEYSFPDVIDSSDYVAGEEVLVNITSTMESVKAIAPSAVSMAFFCCKASLLK